MKQLFILALIAIATGTSAFAGPSTKVNDHFATSFKDVKNVAWKSEEKFDKVSFVQDGKSVEAFYDVDGELIGTSKTMAFDKLPKAALEIITTRYTYPEYKLQDCIEFIDYNNKKSYFISFSKTNENVVLEISKSGLVSVFSRTKK
ncbi:MAG: hypothetical protein JWQ78_340 [Sediminibacterium sp.]|nr:hypothetical protein [Sediminibacterium sp.]